MNTISKTITVLFVAALAAAGCVNEDIRYDNGHTDKTEDIGYLSLAALDVEVLSDTEVIAGPAGRSATRAAGVSPDDFTVDIVNAAGETVRSFRYAERPTEPIELETGCYTLRVASGEIPDLAWDAPVYGASKEFIISRLKETTLGRVICKLASIKVSVEYSADLADQLSADTKVNVGLGDNSVDFGFDETRSAYFKAPTAVNEMNLTITGRYAASAPDEAGFEMTSKLKDVKAGQWRKITIIIEHANEGGVNVRVECENWVFDEVITVETSSMLAETRIEDEPEEGVNPPSVVWLGHDIKTPFTLLQTHFDEYGECTEPFRINADAPNGIAALTVDIVSTNDAFAASLAECGIPASFDLCAPASAVTILTALGYPTGDKVSGQKTVSFNLQPQMKQLFGFGGTHSFRITVTDVVGQKCVETLVLNVGGGGPKIEWVGRDIDLRYTIYDGLDVTIDITSEAGVRDFVVTIDSDTLTPSELESVGLQADIDLVNPGDMAEALRQFGFPLGDEVRGKNEIRLTISNFMGLLMVTGVGEHDFVFKVTDNNGETTVKTLMLRTE